MKICPVGAEFFHADRQPNRRTDRHDEANSWFRNFANAPKNRYTFHSGNFRNSIVFNCSTGCIILRCGSK